MDSAEVQHLLLTHGHSDHVGALAERLTPRADEITWIAPAHSAPVQGFDALSDI